MLGKEEYGHVKSFERGVGFLSPDNELIALLVCLYFYLIVHARVFLCMCCVVLLFCGQKKEFDFAWRVCFVSYSFYHFFILTLLFRQEMSFFIRTHLSHHWPVLCPVRASRFCALERFLIFK